MLTQLCNLTVAIEISKKPKIAVLLMLVEAISLNIIGKYYRHGEVEILKSDQKLKA
jgi:hypothetical protein